MKNSLYFFRWKLLLSDKMSCGIITISFILFIFILHSLTFTAEEKSKIPIGVVNLDESESSEKLVERVKQVSAFHVYEGSENYLKELLLNEQINTIFLIRSGYGKAVKSGQTQELVTMFYLEKSRSAKILSDIFAGEMLYEICLNKGYNLYRTLQFDDKNTRVDSGTNKKVDKKLTEKEYSDYAQKLIEEKRYDFAFDISLVNTKKTDTKEEQLENSVLYQQVIWGILGMVFSLIAMVIAAGAVLDKEMGVSNRIRITLIQSIGVDFSILLVIVTVLSIISLFVCDIVGRKAQLLTWHQLLELYFLLFLFSLGIALWFILLGKFINRVGVYQCIGAMFILLFGFIGFLYIIQSLIPNELLNILKFIPNSWFIQGFTDIILDKSLQDIPLGIYLNLLISALAAGFLNFFVGENKRREI